MSFMKEFKDFAMRGSVMDMAVGIIIGAAFGKVIASFVSDVLMPPIGMLMGNIDFSNMFINLSGKPVETLEAAKAAGIPVIGYGIFINTVVDFLIQALAIFLVIKQINRLRPAPPAPVTQKQCQFCMSTIDISATRCPHCTSELSHQ